MNGRWDGFGPELTSAVTDAVPRLSKIATFAGLLANSPDWERNIHHTELRLAIGVLTCDEGLLTTAAEAAQSIQPVVEWEARVRERCLEFTKLVREEGVAAGEVVLAARRHDVDRHYARPA